MFISMTVSYLIIFGIVQYYAALSEWITGEWRHHDFTTNMFTEAYHCHILTLNKIKAKCLVSYNNMMVEIYQFAV
jgi:hypothetical protein